MAPLIADRPPPWVGEYIGLPWRTLGRQRDGLDCWGLVRLVMADERAVLLPALDGEGWSGSRAPRDLTALADFMGAHRQGWLPVDFTDRRPFDAVLFKVHGRPLHVGLVVAPSWFLHIQKGHDAAVERFDSLTWRDRREGVFRREELA